MTEPESARHNEFSERLRLLIAERDAALAAVNSTYAEALASGAVGDLYTEYLEQRGSALNRFSVDAVALRKEYADHDPAGATPLPETPSPVPAFPRPKQAAQEGSSPAPPKIESWQSPVQPGPDQSTQKLARRGGLILGIMAAAVAVVALVGWIDSTSRTPVSSSSSSESSYLSSARKVVYEVEGTAKSVDITIETPSGTSQQQNLKVPLESKDGHVGLRFEMERGDFVYVAAQNQGSSGTVTCRITVDGVIVSKVTSSGAYAIASCDGSAP